MNPYSTELCHHGILGQRWGKKNGPPYPLDADKHSATEKLAGYTKSLKQNVKKESKKLISKAKETWNDPEKKKKLVKKGAIATAATLTVVGAYLIVKDELRMVPKTVTRYDHYMPIYGAKGKLIFPERVVPRTEQVMVPQYVTRGHKTVGNLMTKMGKGFDTSILNEMHIRR